MESSGKEKAEEGWIEFYDSFNEMFEFFCNNTTIHGTIRLTCSKRNKMKTSFWVVLFFFSFGMMYWQFGLMTGQYWSYPTSMTINLDSTINTYPAVTVCNLNPYRFDQVNKYIKQLDRMAERTLYSLYGYNASAAKERDQETVDLEELLENMENQSDGSFQLNSGIRLVKLQDNGQDPVVSGQSKSRVGFQLCNSSGGDCYYRSFWSGVDAFHEWYKFHFMNIMSRIPLLLPIKKEEIMKNFILTCDHSGMPCDDRNHTHFHHPIYGNCFTINNLGTGNVSRVSQASKLSGLTLTVKTDQNDNMPLLSTSAGARIMIHNPHQPPMVEHEGFDTWPGRETSINIKQDEVNRLDGVYSNCTTDGSTVGFKLLYNTSYTLQSCLHSCFQYKMIDLCGCGYYLYPLPPGAEYCNYNKYPGWGHCFYRLYDKFVNHSHSCFSKCPKPCRETIYQLTAGTAKWPASNSKNWVIPLLSWQNGYNSTSSRSDVSKINLYFQGPIHRSFDEVPAMPVTLLLANMGSQWSLWFGSSVLSVAEMAELVFDAVVMLTIVAYRWQSEKKLRKAAIRPTNSPDENTAIDLEKTEFPRQPLECIRDKDSATEKSDPPKN